MDRLYIYNVIHIAGVIGLFTALGSLIATTKEASNKFGAILHGISMFLILLGGFGMLARLNGSPTQWYVTIKIVIWFLMGAALFLTKRKLLPNGVMYGIILIAGCVATYLGVWGRFIS